MIAIPCPRFTSLAFAAVLLLTASPAPAQLAPGPARILAQGLASIPGPAEEGAFFGSALAFGDFDCDGFDDLAIGAYGADYPLLSSSVADAGAVFVVYGSPQGLSSRTTRIFEADLDDAEALPEAGDRFGLTLGTGNFDGDSAGEFACDDLVVGSPQEDVGSTIDAGAVWVIYGAPGGLDLSRVQLWTQSSPGVRGVSETNDQFGTAFAAGDFDGDTFDDLAVSAPLETLDQGQSEGAVWILRGSAAGLTAPNVTQSSWRQLIHQDLPQVLDVATPGDNFGRALAACDIDDDGRDDLVVGVPGEDALGQSSGSIHTFFGSPDGLDLSGQAEEQTGFAFPEAALGTSLTAGEFGEDPGCEVAAGGPNFGLGGAAFAGIVVAYKPQRGETESAFGFLSASLFPGQEPEAGDFFGSAVVAARFGASGFDDVVIGAPGRGGLDPIGRLFWAETGADSAGPEEYLPAGFPVSGARLGVPLAAGDSDGDGLSEVAVGLFNLPVDSSHPLGLPPGAGLVLLIPSAPAVVIFGDGFESGDLEAWSSVSP